MKYVEGLKKRFLKNKLRSITIVASSIAAVVFALLMISVPRIKADAFDGLYDVRANLSSGGLTLGSSVAIFEGEPGVIYENISINAANESVLILKDVHIRQTQDMPAIYYRQGAGSVATVTNHKIILVGDSVIESTCENAKNPLISVETVCIDQIISDPIRGDRKVSTEYKHILEITDVYEGVNYNGTLTLINAKDSEGAVIGSKGSSAYGSDLPLPGGDGNGITWTYQYGFFGSGDIRITGEPYLNIVNNGFGAGIGGGGILYDYNTTRDTVRGTDVGKVDIEGGTIQIVLGTDAKGVGIGGGSAFGKNGISDEYIISKKGVPGPGADVTIKGGSLYITGANGTGIGNEINGFSFGAGKGTGEVAVYEGSLTDGAGNDVYLYVAAPDATVNGGQFVLGPDGTFGKYTFVESNGSAKYTYTVTDATYENGIRKHFETKVIATTEAEYIYRGNCANPNIYDVEGSVIKTLDNEGKLYFFLPATEVTRYDIDINRESLKYADISTFVDDAEVNRARYDSRVKISITPDQNYVVSNVSVNTASSGRVEVEKVGDEYIFTMPAEAVTVSVEVEIPEFSITYMNDMNSNHGNPTTYTILDSFTLVNPTVPGVKFKGWTDAEGNPVTDVREGTTGDLVFYGTWEDEIYTVTFVDYDDRLIYSQVTKYGGSVTAPADPIRDHYRFTGWDRAFNNVTESIVVKATYEYDTSNPILPYNITISDFWNPGSVEVNKLKAFKDEEIVVTLRPDAGYKVKKIIVSKDNGQGGQVDVNQFHSISGQPTGAVMYLFAMPDSDATISVQYEAADYTITYLNVGNGDHGNPSSYNATDNDITLGNPTKDGYIFDGWFNENGTKVTTIDTAEARNLVLIGNWTPEVIEYDYKITINKGFTHGSVVSSHTTADEGDRITLQITADNGYRLKSLKYVPTTNLSESVELANGDNYSGGDVVFYMPARDIIITAEFETIHYNIVYVDTDISNNPTTYTIEDEIIFEVPIKEGYDFDKWYDVNANIVTKIPRGTTGNKIIVATWTKAPVIPNVYSINVDSELANGAVSSDKSNAQAGEVIIVNVSPAKGYVLERLQFVPDDGGAAAVSSKASRVFAMASVTATRDISVAAEPQQLDSNSYVFTMPAMNVKITAVFKKATYRITYINGELHSNPASYTVDDEIIFAEPTKEGYEFKGWYDTNGNRKLAIAAGNTGDITLIARWESIEPPTEEETTTKKNDVEETTTKSENPTTDNHITTKPSEENTTKEPFIVETTTRLPSSNIIVDTPATEQAINITKKPSAIGDKVATADSAQTKIHNYGFMCIVSIMVLIGALLYKGKEEEN